jgi:hypothetical protein
MTRREILASGLKIEVNPCADGLQYFAKLSDGKVYSIGMGHGVSNPDERATRSFEARERIIAIEAR